MSDSSPEQPALSIQVSVVIPFYNEVQNVLPLWEKIAAAFLVVPDYSYECVFVNDGSTDGTRKVLDDLATAQASVRVIHLVANSGQSAAIAAGLQRARGEYILTLDGDLQNDPADFPEFLNLLQRFDCVCGYRAHRNDTWMRRLSSRAANSARNAVLRDGIRDSGCGSKGFRRHRVKHLVPFNGMHRFMAALLRSAGCTIVESPVSHHARHSGVSKYGLHNRLWRGIYDLIGVAWFARRYVAFRVEGEE